MIARIVSICTPASIIKSLTFVFIDMSRKELKKIGKNS